MDAFERRQRQHHAGLRPGRLGQRGSKRLSAAGWWLHFQGRLRFPRIPIFDAENGIFIDGPELDTSNPPRMPVTGEATYSGGAGGLYIYEYGANWGDLAGSEATEEYGATFTLTADFANRTMRGCLGCTGDINVERTHLRTILGRQPSDDLQAPPTDYELHFGSTPFTQSGDFEQADVRVTHPERNVVGAIGFSKFFQQTRRRRQSPAGNGIHPELVPRRRRRQGAFPGTVQCPERSLQSVRE